MKLGHFRSIFPLFAAVWAQLSRSTQETESFHVIKQEHKSVSDFATCKPYTAYYSAVSNRGTLMFRLYRGGLSILKYLRFIRDLQKDAGHPIVLIVDNLRIHHAKIVKAWLRKRRNLIRVFYLPAYSPELNPDKWVNSDLKIAIGQREPAQDRDE